MPLVLFFCLASCRKVGLTPVGAGFSIADASWFEAEQTLFLFYEVQTEQGLSDKSTLEVSYESDAGGLVWKELRTLPQVHTHLPVSCGRLSLCGSGSLRVSRRPRDVRMRLRYHRDGETALEVAPALSYVDSGDAFRARSYVAYGVFDASNQVVQWRGRHNFPVIANLEAERLGLRRLIKVTEQVVGSPAKSEAPDNPYLYGAALDCKGAGFTALGEPALETRLRAKWNAAKIPTASRDATFVCAKATTRAATGEFTTDAYARRNADTGVAIDALASPITKNTPLRFVLRPCRTEISADHLGMQKQRLLMGGDEEEVCLDGLDAQGAQKALGDALAAATNEKRKLGSDMLASLAYHHDAQGSDAWRQGIQAALKAMLDAEIAKSSPRLTGAFVFDSDGETTLGSDLKSRVLWCPARIPPRKKGERPLPPDESQKACAVQPGAGTLAKLGPLAIATIPIFATRDQYVDYVHDYGEAQAGRMKDLTFLAPSHTPLTDVAEVETDEFKRATFRDNETVQTTKEQAFSYCAPGGRSDPFVFRASSADSPVALARLPERHLQDPAASYELGLLWDFPFLTRLDYVTVLAGSASAFGASVPFGIRNSASEYYGERDWLKTSHSLKDVLVQCRRFCAHPPFDSAGVYNVRLTWKDYYARVCDRSLLPKAAFGREESPYDP